MSAGLVAVYVYGQFLSHQDKLLRAEEELKESSAVPFVMGLLLTILSFPKPVALAPKDEANPTYCPTNRQNNVTIGFIFKGLQLA